MAMYSKSDSTPRSKCYATHGLLPLDLGRDRYPKSKKPFSTILAAPWYHNIDLILPTEILKLVDDAIEREAHHLSYSRVHMKLEELIEGDFFNIYIKTGTIEMLSEGPPTRNTQYSLQNGILRLDLPKAIFQRLGLDGKSIPSGGRKHVPTRMRIEINLRLPSMVSGRKGFERIRLAFKNVLNDSVTWLFRDCKPAVTKKAFEGSTDAPIAKLHPLERNAHPPKQIVLSDIVIPKLEAPSEKVSSAYLRSDTALDIMEWLSMISLQSPRIKVDDNIDRFLSRYAIEPDISAPASVTLVRWHGFIPAIWIIRLVMICKAYFQIRPEAWFAINASAIRLQEGSDQNDGWCLLYTPRAENEGSKLDGMVLSMPETEPARSTAEAANVHNNKARDFMIWEMVDCVTQR